MSMISLKEAHTLSCNADGDLRVMLKHRHNQRMSSLAAAAVMEEVVVEEPESLLNWIIDRPELTTQEMGEFDTFLATFQ